MTSLLATWLDRYFTSEVTPPLPITGTGALHNVPSLNGADRSSSLRFEGVAPDVSGIKDGSPGRRIQLIAAGGPLLLEEESVFSDPENRIITGAGNVEFPINSVVWLLYDDKPKRWYVAGSGTGGGGGAGADGRTILSGAGAPGGGLGANGDFYINTTAWTIYGPKTAGAWGSATSLIGPPGGAGADGRTTLSGAGAPGGGLGANGDFYINTTAWTIYGPKTAGAWGSATSLIGPPGSSAAIGTFSSRPANASGTLFYPTDGGFHQIADGTNWFNMVGGIPLKEPPATATIATQTNFGTSTLTKTNGVLVFSPQVAAGPLVRTAGKSIVTLSGATVTFGGSVASPAGAGNGLGVYMRESSTGKILSFTLQTNASGLFFVRETWTNASARANFTAYAVTTYEALAGAGFTYLSRLKVSSTNVLVEISCDGGLNWSTLDTIALTTPFTTQPDEYGVCAHVENNSTPASVLTFHHVSFVGD